jgi:hypothetical protein
LGLIAYIISTNELKDPNVWNKLEWIFKETLAY